MSKDSLESSTNDVAEQIVNCINGNGEEIKKLYDCLNHLNDKTKIRFEELEERIDRIEKELKK